ncbi:MAG TPA: anthranilate phosphoribosyltransferase [Planctomycetaceae bacterium]|nr:anthranilate phosphoribosyltransferase [Planctomycetaceae bacterium]
MAQASTPPTTLQLALGQLTSGESLDSHAAYAAFGTIMDGGASDVEMAAFLAALRVKGESVDEIVGAARAMCERSTPVPVHRSGLLDTCGTGGDGLHTFNISTATAFVVAACGVPVAKHGNRGVSSSSGSADVLEQLGVQVGLTPEGAARCIEEIGLGFCFAPTYHTAMRYVAPVRRQLKFRTIFNLLGPLTNPARAEYQLIGVSRVQTAGLLARALADLGRKHAFVVCGADQLDEVSLWGETTAIEVEAGTLKMHRWTVADFGLPPCAADDLTVASPAESAGVIREVFAGKPGPHRNMVLANAAAALLAAVKVGTLAEGVARATEAIDSGRARDLLGRLVALSQKLAPPTT